MLLYEEISNKILRAYFNVIDTLAYGYAEEVYENALCIEFDEMGIPYERQKLLNVNYKGHLIGTFKPDIIVDGKIIIELKAIANVLPIHEAQIYNYLAITSLDIGYILNFGENRTYRRYLRKGTKLNNR
ncbi:MAG: GxxExxY protein [Prevotella sp.]|nr:GxxExxY protein [Prevotella sp.]